jgi:release factor glutamine methyltransferase
LRIAGINADALAPGRVQLHLGSWLEPLEGRFEVIVSNPPYVAEGDPHLLEGDCRFEPRDALTPGTDAMAAIRHIAEHALPCLGPGGLLAFEHGFDQGEPARKLLFDLGYGDVSTARDLEGRERVSSGLRT